jgi:low temperature requirement protein LtrA
VVAASQEPPILRARGDPEPPTFLELLFDLVYILIFARISQGLAQDLTWRGALQTAVLLCVVMWVWVLTAWLTDLFDPRLPKIQLLVVLIMFGGLLMGVAAPTAFDGHGLLFAGAYLAIVFTRGAFLIIGTRGNTVQARSVRLLFWYAVSGPLWIWGAYTHGSLRLAIWGVAVSVDFISARFGWPTPGLGRTELSGRIFTAEHLFERHRQIFIISLGELILNVGLGFVHGGYAPGRLISLAVSFGSAVLLFQIYFYRARELLFSPTLAPLDEVRPGISTSFAHLVMVGGVVVLAVSDDVIARGPLATGTPAATAVIVGGPALFLLGSSLFDVVLRRLLRPRVAALILLVVTAPALNFLPVLVIAILTNLVLLGALLGELAIRRREARARVDTATP